MKRVSSLTEADQAALTKLHQAGNLTKLHQAGKTHRQRQRAHAVLLSAQGHYFVSAKGLTLDQLAVVCDADRDTISGWFEAWQERGLDGLTDAPKSGRRRKIDGSLETILRDILIENPSPNMKALLQDEIKKRAL